MPIKLCQHAGCPNPPSYRGRCAQHARHAERAIPRQHHAVYSRKRWAQTRKAQLARAPICERCQRRLATQVHHRTDLAQGGHPWAPDNLESLCARCHARHTRQQQLHHQATP